MMPGKVTILFSIAVNVLVAVTLFWPSDVSSVETPPETTIILESKLAEDTAEQHSQKTESPPEAPSPERHGAEAPPEEAPPAVEYAGAPGAAGKTAPPREAEAETVPKEPDAGLQASDPEQSKPLALPVETIDADQPHTPLPSQTQLAAVADQLKVKGLDAPRATVNGLSVEEFETIVEAGQGRILAICEGRYYIVSGELAEPRELTPLTDGQANRLSDRGLLILAAHCTAVREKLLWNHGYNRHQIARCRVLLIFSSGLDHLILWRQKEAAGKAGVGLAALRETVGRFRWSQGRVADFQVLALVSKNRGAGARR